MVAAPLVALLLLPETSDASRFSWLRPLPQIFAGGRSVPIVSSSHRRDYLIHLHKERARNKNSYRHNGKSDFLDSQLESCIQDAVGGAAGTINVSILHLMHHDDIDLSKLPYSQSTLRPILKAACGADALLNFPLFDKLPETPLGLERHLIDRHKTSIRNFLTKVNQTEPSHFSSSPLGSHPERPSTSESLQPDGSNFLPTTEAATDRVSDAKTSMIFDIPHSLVCQYTHSFDANEQPWHLDVYESDVTGVRQSNVLSDWQPTRRPTPLVPKSAVLRPRRSPPGKQRPERQVHLS